LSQIIKNIKNFNWKKLSYSFIIILFTILIKSICQYYLGAEATSLGKIISSLDFSFFSGSFLGSIIIIFIESNWDICKAYFSVNLDSDDENARDKIVDKGKKPEQQIDKGKKPEWRIDKGLPFASTSAAGNSFASTSMADNHLASDSAAGIPGLGRNTNVKLSMSTKEKADVLLKSIYLAEGIKNELVDYEEAFNEYIRKLKKQADIILESKDHINMNYIKNDNDIKAFEYAIKMSLTALSLVYEKAGENRSLFLMRRVVDLKLSNEDENKLKIENSKEIIKKARAKFLSDLDLINPNKEFPVGQIKTFYASMNLQKNIIDKELNKLDSIILKELKQCDCCAFKNDLSRDLVKKLNDYNKANKNFNIEYNIVKRHLSDVINRRNNLN